MAVEAAGLNHSLWSLSFC